MDKNKDGLTILSLIILLGGVGHSSFPKNDSNMQPSDREKVRQAIAHAKEYFKSDKPNITIEYNLENEPEEEWFEGFPHHLSEKTPRGDVRYIYKLS